MRRNPAYAPILDDQVDEHPMESRIARIESDVSYINKTLTRLEVEVHDLRKGQEAANDAITGVKIGLATLNGKLESLDHRVDALETKVDDRFDALDTKINDVSQSLEAKITETNKILGDRISAVDYKLTDQTSALDGKLTDQTSALDDKLTNKISALADGLAKLQGTVNTIGIAIALLTAIIALGRALPWILDSATP